MMDIKTLLERFQDVWGRLRERIGAVLVGQREAVEGVMVCLFAGGHCLIEGVPGIGKTALVRTLAKATGLRFARIQFTPDLMPSDITGSDVFVEEKGEFGFRRGPLFAHLVLADEINRATPKTQSALLEAMQEGQVTVGERSHPLPQPFMVAATQNPIEMEGTYPLPEAQLDRFMFKLRMEMPEEEELLKIAERTTGAVAAEEKVEAVEGLGESGVLQMQRLVREVVAANEVAHLAARLVTQTHPSRSSVEAVKRWVRLGASPRGMQALLLGAKVLALADGRMNVAFDDIKALVLPALRHRLILPFEAQAEGITPEQVLESVVEAVT